jgi:hypothetical protein
VSFKLSPSIILTERLNIDENKKLDVYGKFRCKYGIVHTYQEGCKCKSHGKEKEKQFIISPELKTKALKAFNNSK